ncbi:hypothetical protein BDZ97DRAFT_1835068, partial [Flammula alnicola]
MPGQSSVKISRIPFGLKSTVKPQRYSPERDNFDPRQPGTSTALLMPENDPRSPVSPAHQHNHTSSGFMDPTSSSHDMNVSDTKKSLHPLVEEISRMPPSCTALENDASVMPASERSSLKPSKSAEGLGMGLPSDLASRPPHQRDISSHGSVDSGPKMMSTAEECQNIVQLSSASQASSSSPPTLMVSEERGGSRYFFKIPTFAKRYLYDIPEVLSPPISEATDSSRRASPSSGNRLLSSAWSDLANCLRSPSRSGHSWFQFSTPWSVSPLAGSSGNNPSFSDLPAPTSVQPSAPLDDIPLVQAPATDISNLPQPPVLSPKSNRFARFGLRFSGSSRSRSPTAEPFGVKSPGMIKNLDAPRGLGIFTRKAAASTTSPKGEKRKPTQTRCAQVPASVL